MVDGRPPHHQRHDDHSNGYDRAHPCPLAPIHKLFNSLRLEPAPDLTHVGGTGEHATHNTINATFTGVTSDAKIAPRLTSTMVDQSRATIPRTV
jgi:hypothetical protein